MTPRATAALPIIFHLEGGFANKPRDPGGATKYGISLRFLREHGIDLNGDGQTTEADIEALTIEKAEDLYYRYFWLPVKAEEMPSFTLSVLLFDAAVNQGPGTAVKILQKTAGVAEDGVVGPQTLAAVKRAHTARPFDFYATFLRRRARRYMENENFDVFGDGWLQRLFHLCTMTTWIDCSTLEKKDAARP